MSINHLLHTNKYFVGSKKYPLTNDLLTANKYLLGVFSLTNHFLTGNKSY